MENTDESQRYRKLLRIHKLLQKIYSKLQSHGKTIKQIEEKEGMDMEQRTLEGF